MVIRFFDDIDRLSEDLEFAGYTVVRVSKFPRVPARTIQLQLSNGVLVSWDRQAQTLTLDGPRLQRSKVEICLVALYEGNWFTRAWLLRRQRLGLTTAALALLIGGLAVAATLSRIEATPVESARSAIPQSP